MKVAKSDETSAVLLEYRHSLSEHSICVERDGLDDFYVDVTNLVNSISQWSKCAGASQWWIGRNRLKYVTADPPESGEIEQFIWEYIQVMSLYPNQDYSGGNVS